MDESLEAFEKALQLTPERVNLLLSYAQALLVTESAENMQKAAQSLGLVLQKDPANTDALSMLALLAQQRGDVGRSARGLGNCYWHRYHQRIHVIR